MTAPNANQWTDAGLARVLEAVKAEQSERELRELAEIGKRAVAEHAAWVTRNETRKEHRDFLRRYERETGEWFAIDKAEPEDVERHHQLLQPAREAQKNLTSARAYTRRAIVRAAAEIGRAMP